MALVSIIVPVYSVEKSIERCLTSIQQQTLSDIEIIVVNDCTPDNSMSVVERLASQDRRFKVLAHNENMGLMLTRRTGYLHATGDYITFCDSDDLLPENAVEKLYHAARQTDADVVSGNINYLKAGGISVIQRNRLLYGDKRADVLKSLLRHELGHNLCSKLFKATLLQDFEYKTYEGATNGEDACLFYQIVANMESIILIDDVVYYYIQNVDSSSQVRRTEKALRSLCMTNAEIVATVSPFNELKKDLAQNISSILVDLVYRGYNKDGTLSAMYDEFGLTEYFSNATILRAHTLPNAIKLLLKKYVVRRKTV